MRLTTASWQRSAVGDPGKAARFAAPFEAHAYTAFADVLNDSAVGAVYISTPNALHFEQTLAALEAGKHVLVEKPMALAVSDAQRMERAASDMNRLLSVGFHLRHHPVHAEMRRRVLAGEVGQAAFAAATFGSNWVDPPVDAWQMDPALAGHGSMAGLGVHLFDLLPWLLGQSVVEVSALSDGPTAARPVEFLTQVMLRFDGGTYGHVVCSRRLPHAANSLVVYGDKARLDGVRTIGVDAEGHLESVSGAETTRYEPTLTDLYTLEIEAFARALHGADEVGASPADGVNSVAITEAAAESARTGRSVRPATREG